MAVLFVLGGLVMGVLYFFIARARRKRRHMDTLNSGALGDVSASFLHPGAARFARGPRGWW